MLSADGARQVPLAGRVSRKYRRTSSKVRACPRLSAYQSCAFGEPPAPQNGSLMGKPSMAPARFVPEPVCDAEADAPAARLVRLPVRSTPALAMMSVSRALLCTTWVGACRPDIDVLKATVPDVLTAPVSGL